MKHKRVTVLLVLMAIVLLVIPAVAQSSKASYTIIACEIEQIDPGTAWVSGDNVLHFRNEVVVHEVHSDEPLLQGRNRVTRSGDINLSTGRAHIYGSFDYQVTGVNGAWDGRFTIQAEPGLPYWGNGTAQGKGDLAGMTQKIQFAPLPPDYPNNPCVDAATTGMHMVTIIDHSK